jgi:hypothetical protein
LDGTQVNADAGDATFGVGLSGEVAGVVVVLGAGVTTGAGGADEGGLSTVSVAALLVAVSSTFVNAARYSRPLSAPVVCRTASVSVVLPASVVSFAHVDPLSVETCHRTSGAGTPETAAVNTAPSPANTV